VDNIIENALKAGDYIVQHKIPLNLWGEMIPEMDMTEQTLRLKQFQTDSDVSLGRSFDRFPWQGRGIPTNVGSGGGVQSLALVDENDDIRILPTGSMMPLLIWDLKRWLKSRNSKIILHLKTGLHTCLGLLRSHFVQIT